jgi:uncharacterized repeat protein (TIGR02543 family)
MSKYNLNNMAMKIINLISICFVVTLTANAQVTLSTDFTNETNKKAPIHNIWSVANRISPKNGANVRPDLKVNLVRMIGGINKIVNGEKVPDLDFDPCRYDSSTGTYVYDWDILIDRLDAIVYSDVEIHQIVLDQPPWAFQHGYTFIPSGTNDGIHFREDEKISHYGNSLPPYDKEAYFDFIAALMTKLVDTYGKEKVLSWRFRVGSEIETPDHWFGTEQDFIEHFANTEKAVRSVLPNAQVGLHTRYPGFLYKNGTVLNYKGEVIKSFADGLIEYCYDHDVRFDFLGISDYVRVINQDSRTMDTKYDKLFAPLINHPKWNEDASIDLMEYKAVTTMNGADGKGTIGCETSHREIVELAFSNQFYRNEDKGLERIYRWNNRTGSTNPINIEMVNTMVGKTRYTTQTSGVPILENNELDAIFSKDETKDVFDVIIYNYNASSLDYNDEEPVELSFIADLPVGTILNYRYLNHGKEENKLQNFLENEPPSGWIKSGFNAMGEPSRVLNEAGILAWENYTNSNPSSFSEWVDITTQARTDGGEGSVVKIETELASFAFKKFEFRTLENADTVLNTPQYIWTTNEDFQQFSTSQMTSVITGGTINMSITGNYPKLIYDTSFDVDNFDGFRVVVKNATDSDIFYFVWYKDGVKNQLRFRPGINETSFHTYTVDLSGDADWNGTIDSFNVEVANKSSLGGSVEIDSMELMLKDGVEEHIVTTNIIEGSGIVSPYGGSVFTGQDVTFVAYPDAGWEFVGWSGHNSSTDNPLNITVVEDITLNAIFQEDGLSSKNNQISNNFKIYPNPSHNGNFNLSSRLKWEVYDLAGVKLNKGDGNRVNLSNFSKGIYILKIENGSSFKLIY